MAQRQDPAVTNAADAEQVKRAKRSAAERAALFNDALRAVLGTPEGRVVMWELLRQAGIYESVWDQSSKIHYNAGRQDFGHLMLAACLAADEEGYQLMEREGRDRQRKEMAGWVAARTPRAGTAEG